MCHLTVAGLAFMTKKGSSTQIENEIELRGLIAAETTTVVTYQWFNSDILYVGGSLFYKNQVGGRIK